MEQDSKFDAGDTVRTVIENSMESAAVTESERGTRFAETLGRAGFQDLEAEATICREAGRNAWRLSRRVVQGPDVLLLDEPTNHLDLAGIEWLEALLAEAAFRLRGGKSRPLLSGKCRDRND